METSFEVRSLEVWFSCLVAMNLWVVASTEDVMKQTGLSELANFKCNSWNSYEYTQILLVNVLKTNKFNNPKL